jgi:FxLD family lantipeptide
MDDIATTTPAEPDDVFDLDALLVVDTAAEPASRGCNTDDGCTPTCVSSCTSGS